MRGAIIAFVACVLMAAGATWVLASTDDPLGFQTTGCTFPQTVVSLHFSQSKYPTIYQHYQDAVSKGWPKVLIKDATDATYNRSHLLKGVPTKDGYDRDEYPPAEGREGWLGTVMYVPSSENRSQGASMGSQLSQYCDGVRFQYDWTP